MMHPAASSSPAADGTKVTGDLMKGLVPEQVNSQTNGRVLEVQLLKMNEFNKLRGVGVVYYLLVALFVYHYMEL